MFFYALSKVPELLLSHFLHDISFGLSYTLSFYSSTWFAHAPFFFSLWNDRGHGKIPALSQMVKSHLAKSRTCFCVSGDQWRRLFFTYIQVQPINTPAFLYQSLQFSALRVLVFPKASFRGLMNSLDISTFPRQSSAKRFQKNLLVFSYTLKMLSCVWSELDNLEFHAPHWESFM